MLNQMVSHSYLIFVLLLLMIRSMNVSKIYSSENFPLWTWDCVKEKCVPSKTSPPDKPQSLITCNMLCAPIALWPQPTGPVTLSTSSVPVRADLFQLRIVTVPSTAVHEHLRDAFDLLKQDLRKLENESFGFEEWHSVALRVSVAKNGSADPRMLLNTDESYKLSVTPEGNSLVVHITANSFCGARHGLETLSQLVWFDPYVESLFMLAAANVEDAPRYRYRGLLLDTAHNYFPVADLLRTIDAMAACKLNTFHWHATDFQAFPLLLNSAPRLSRFGAYSSEAIYAPDDVRMVVHRARLRGIRVLLEIDVPPYVDSTFEMRTNTELGKTKHCVDNQSWNAHYDNDLCKQFDPHNSRVYDILENVYREISQLTGVNDVFHIGGDVVSGKCWSENFNYTDRTELWLEHTRNVLKRLESVNGKLPELTLLWASDLTERMKIDLKKYISNIGLQVRNVGWSQKHISGIRAVISHEDVWDLNSGFGAWHEDSGGVPYNSWQRVYEYRPWARGTKCIQGGEAMVWSFVLSADGLDSRVWPRAAALAERWWSDRAKGATRSVHARLDIHRSRLVSKGIQAAPLWSMWCTHNPYTCD